jgi:hypothetical protein
MHFADSSRASIHLRGAAASPVDTSGLMSASEGGCG